jgi:glyoxylase I family protein
MINCIHHVAVHVHDVDRMTRFYKGAFGFEAGTILGNALKWDMKVTKPVSLTLKYD